MSLAIQLHHVLHRTQVIGIIILSFNTSLLKVKSISSIMQFDLIHSLPPVLQTPPPTHIWKHPIDNDTLLNSILFATIIENNVG